MAKQPDDRPARAQTWPELFATILLALAAVGTAWSSYQATRWNGEQALAASRTNAVRIAANRADTLANDQTQVDVATFIAWTGADRRGERQLADFYVSRFRPEFRTAFDAWIATRPFANPNAPPTPLAMPEYQVAARQDAAHLDDAAEAGAAEVRRDIQRASNYVLTVVLYAVALFFAGMSTRLGNRRLRIALIVCGYVVLVAAVAWVATFPVSLKI
jgi:hypothetical protein